MQNQMSQPYGGWQNYAQGPQQNFGAFSQNGGNMPVQQPVETPFVGRYINQIEEVMPREVPMDGRAAIFPTQTLEEIYLKVWDRNGSIRTIRYVLDPMQNFAQNQSQELDMGSKILERLEQLEQRLSVNDQPKQSSRRTNSKGGEENA